MSVTGGCSTRKVIGLGGSTTGTGTILSPGLCTVTRENDMMSVVMGGNVIIWSLIVTGSGVIVVDSVSLIGGSSMIQGGLHVTTGDDVSHISGNAIVERLTLVVRLVLKVVLGTRSNKEEAKDVVKTNDESAVDELELVLPLICIAAVPVLVFELVRELSTTELVRRRLLDASENVTSMAGVVTFPITVALAIPVDVVTTGGIEIASTPRVKFPGIEVLVVVDEKARDVVRVFGVVMLLPSDSEVGETCTLRLILVVDKALVMVKNGLPDAKGAVAFCDLQSSIPVFTRSKVEVKTVELLGEVEDPLEKEFMPINVELSEVVSSLLMTDGDFIAINEVIVNLEIVLLLSCEAGVAGGPESEVSARFPELLCPGTSELSGTVCVELTTVDTI
jgi:hypothetical protein